MRRSLLSVTLSFSFLFPLFSQKIESRKSLYDILQKLEQSYHITFSYTDDVIAGKEVLTSDINSLSEWLDYLAANTGLTFHRIDDQYIAISKIVTVCGQLIDQQSGAPVGYATIATRGSVTVSEETGYFKINDLKEDTLLVNHVGYYPVLIVASELDHVDCIAIRLKPRFTSLEEVVIQNYIVKGISKTRSGSLLMRPQEQEILPGLTEPDVLFTLQAFPGIESVSESVSDINIRGGTNDQNLVLWDGIRMYQTGHFFGLISAFNPYITKKVTLIKNGTSAEYGSGVSGTIVMESEDGKPEVVTGGAGANLIHTDFHSYVPLSKKLTVGLSGRRSTTDLFKTYTFKRYNERAFQVSDLDPIDEDSLLQSEDQFYFYDIHTKLDYRPSERDRLTVSALFISNQLEYFESARVSGETERRISELEQRSLAGSVGYSRLWNDRFRTNLDGYVSLYKLSALNQNILGNQQLLQENEVIDLSLMAKVHYILRPDLDLRGGYGYEQIGVGQLEELDNPSFRRFIFDVLDAHFLFAEANFRSDDDKAVLNAGVRLNYYPQLGQLLIGEPRVSFNYALSKAVSFEFLGEVKNQTVNQIIDLQTDFLGIERRRWVLSNERDLPVVRGRQASAGLHYDHNEFLLTVEGYVKKVEGITTSSQGFLNQYRLIRTSGDYLIAGMDLLMKKTFDPFSLWLSYSYARNNYTFPELRPQTFPSNFDIRHQVFVGSSLRLGHFQTSVGVNWRSGRPFTPPAASQPVLEGQINYRDANSERIGHYLRMDFSSTYSFSMGKKINGQAGLSIWNVTNSSNTIDTFYQLSSGDDVERVNRMALAFTPNLMFRISF